jgi:hypothetical protein
MNKGIQKASGTYVLFLNSGDYFADENVLMEVARSGPKEDLVAGNIIFLENGNMREDITPDKLGKFYLLHSMLYHPVTFVRRQLFIEFGLYNQSFRIVSDYEFFLRILSAGKITYRHLNLFIACFDNTGLSASPSTKQLMLKEREEVQKEYFNPILLFCFRTYKQLKSALRNFL